MFILYFDHDMHEYYHATAYKVWTSYASFRASECLWLVPGTDPEDPAWGL